MVRALACLVCLSFVASSATDCRGAEIIRQSQPVISTITPTWFQKRRLIASTKSSRSSSVKRQTKSSWLCFQKCKAIRRLKIIRYVSRNFGASDKKTATTALCFSCSSKTAKCSSKSATAWKARCRTSKPSISPNTRSNRVFVMAIMKAGLPPASISSAKRFATRTKPLEKPPQNRGSTPRHRLKA